MTCFMCKGNMESKTSSYIVDLNNCIIIVKNVPSLICTQCGEVFYTNDVMKKLEKIVDTLQNVVTEIAVVNYSDRVA